MVYWIVGAIGIEIQTLWIARTRRAVADGINLGEAALLRVVVAVVGVIQARYG